MKVLLVSPLTPDTFWSFKHALPFVSKRASMPPLGLLTVAGMLPRKWDCRLIDLNVGRLHDADLAWADVVLVSGMLIHRESIVEIVARAKRAGNLVAGGGPVFREDMEPIEGIDCLFLGEAEGMINQFVADLEAGRLQGVYHAPRFPSLDSTPIPRWDLIRLDDYVATSIQSCRGCPFDCEFCDIVELNGRRPRYKSPEQVVAELDSLRVAGWQGSTFFVDDNFIGNRKRCKELLCAVIDWRRKTRSSITFLTEASVNLAEDPELLTLMAQAGFKKVFLGIETPNAESLKECHKVQNTHGDLFDSVRTIQAAGMQVMGGFIIGFDADSPDIFERQYDFIQRAGVVTAMVGLLQAIPRSRLYQRLRDEGRLLTEGLGDNTRAALNFETKLDKDFLLENYRALMQRLYEPTVYYQRVRNFLKQYKPSGPREHLSREELMAAFKSLWLQGVVYPGRRAYWLFMAGTLFRRPSKLGSAFTLAILGHHFRTVARGL